MLIVDIFELKSTNDAEQQKELDYKFEQFGGVLRFLVKPFATAETLVSEALERDNRLCKACTKWNTSTGRQQVCSSTGCT